MYTTTHTFAFDLYRKYLSYSAVIFYNTRFYGIEYVAVDALDPLDPLICSIYCRCRGVHGGQMQQGALFPWRQVSNYWRRHGRVPLSPRIHRRSLRDQGGSSGKYLRNICILYIETEREREKSWFRACAKKHFECPASFVSERRSYLLK